MSTRLKKNYHYLKVLHDSKKPIRQAILEGADKDLIDALCEVIKNIREKNLEITPELRKQLQRRAKVLKEISSKKVSLKRKKKLLIQQGGFLPALIAPLVAIAGSLISGLV